jgi:hypothetical protein
VHGDGLRTTHDWKLLESVTVLHLIFMLPMMWTVQAVTFVFWSSACPNYKVQQRSDVNQPKRPNTTISIRSERLMVSSDEAPEYDSTKWKFSSPIAGERHLKGFDGHSIGKRPCLNGLLMHIKMLSTFSNQG